MNDELTLMAVHAHPDDEVMSTGGVLAQASDQGIRTVLVTCTNGEQGDGPGGVKPGEEGHDEADVRERRLSELRESVATLGVAHLELLGYRDSGMVGWSANEHPDAFANVPVDRAAARLAVLMERYRPDVVVTYDDNGGYGHPDHIQAHRVAVAAATASGIPRKFYFTAMPRARMAAMFERMRELHPDAAADWEMPDDFGTPDELITTVVDVSGYAERKLKAIQAHASQGDTIFLLRLPPEVQRGSMSFEAFTRHYSRVAGPEKEDDLFAGLR
jgi:LmbE family N-acetylglucosaminyl deacetylase